MNCLSSPLDNLAEHKLQSVLFFPLSFTDIKESPNRLMVSGIF